MKSFFFRCQLAGILAASSFYVQSVAAQGPKSQPPLYNVTDLGTLNGANPGPLVLKNNGLIATAVAVPNTPNTWYAAISVQGTTQIDLAQPPGPGGLNSAAWGVNERGQAAGAAETGAALAPNSEDFCGFGTQRICNSFIWQNGVMQALPLLKDQFGVAGNNAGAKGINIKGQVAGTAENTTPDTSCPQQGSVPLAFQYYEFEPVIWSNGEIQQLPTSGIDANGNPYSDTDGVAFRINDSGQAVGGTGGCTGFTQFSYLNGLHATLWQNGSVIDLGNFGGIATGPPGSGLGNFGNFAYDVNRSGQVVGTAGTSDGTPHAFVWTPGKLIQDLGFVEGDSASIGLAISDHGDTGGASIAAGGATRAFLRPADGEPLDLNSLVTANPENLYLLTVCSINSSGELIGLAFDSQFNFHGYLARPSDAGDASSAESLAARQARFEHAWSVLRDRLGPFGGFLSRR